MTQEGVGRGEIQMDKWGGRVGHLSKEQFAALVDEWYRIENNLRNSHIDEVHTSEHWLFLIFSSKPFAHLLLTLSIVVSR